MFSTSTTQSYTIEAGDTKSFNTKSLRSFPLSVRERGLLLALIWGEPLPQAAQRLEMSPGEAYQMLARLQQRAGVPTRQALIARAVAHRWTG